MKDIYGEFKIHVPWIPNTDLPYLYKEGYNALRIELSRYGINGVPLSAGSELAIG